MAEKQYLIEPSELRVGDIILTADQTFSSKGIRIKTNSDFSHAMIYVAYSSCIHALTDGGVQSINLQRRFFTKPEHVKVLRLIDEPAADVLNCACTYARTQVGKQYSIADAVRSQTPGRRVSNRQYCSRLVAESYAYAGIKLVPDPHKCVPEDLNKNPLLADVPVTVREAKDEEFAFSKSLDQTARQTKITKQMFSRIRSVTESDIQTDEQVVAFLLKNPKFDVAVTYEVKKSGYLEMWKYEVEKNRWRYDADALSSCGLSIEQVLPLICCFDQRPTARAYSKI